LPNFTALSDAEILAGNQGQLRAAINQVVNGWSLRQMRVFLLDSETVTDPPIITRRADGQIESQTEVTRDVGTGARVGTKTVNFTYFPTGEMETHEIKWLDAADRETRKQAAKYFLDGRDLEVVETRPAKLESVK